ncbi:lasso peptide biosynthesis PqqD family chaperone [Paenibacillus albidus]|uniref:lasso peptide biosynthesis PqqD family chaperone n=1 Tax=Paenibacillus albidus TaxID=2041023 RepID=UPI001BE5F1F1|nr:lasso peptide biosynthesis PqqD family chaperone [Paenibacillus albidus]MBT2289673.1 lasso peptide biosynthesis PqqD family chaperone [Paenibacillus albidus]
MSTTNILSLDTVLTQQPGNIASDMDGEKVMLNVKNGKYYNLGEVGGEIWTAIATPASVSSVVAAITQLFEVPAELAERDVLSFLQHLLDEDLAAIAGQP